VKKMFALIACVLFVAACNTMEGVGKDIKKGGEAIEKAAK
jgi:entericidin B